MQVSLFELSLSVVEDEVIGTVRTKITSRPVRIKEVQFEAEACAVPLQ